MNNEDVENEFDESHRIKGALYPYDNKTREKCEPQWTKLKAALSDNHIKNIAITSSYDTGKTSFLKSFFKKECADSEYKFITIPTFSEKQKSIDEENLEKNVINQLLFSEDPSNFPNSRIDRIHVYSNWWILLIWATLWILGELVFSLTPIAPTFWNNNADRKGVILVIALIISLLLIYHVVHNSYKLSWNAKASLGPVELSGANDKDNGKQSDQNLFILYGDEIKYYFSRSKVKYVILEDMDRFNNIDIFQKLRELNNNINESEWLRKRKKKVVFIYTLSDTIFRDEKIEGKTTLVNENKAAESKSKFFDYVISLMPFDNLNSSEKIFREEIEKYEDIKELNISDNILLGVSLYISDRREITCIIADMDTYVRNLNRVQEDLESRLKEEQPDFGDKLFAAMIYKNVYPQDFDNLTKGKSYLGYFLQEIDTLKAFIYDNQDDIKGGYIYTQFQNDESIANLLSVVWDSYYEFSPKNDSDLDDKLKSALAYIKETNVLRFLLAQNLIEGDFYEYISPTQFESLSSPEQITFIRNALARRRNDIDFEINDEKIVDKIIDIFDMVGVDYSYVYSSSILERIITQPDKEDCVSQMIEGLSDIGRFATGKEEERIVNSKVQFIDKVITWLYVHKSEIDDGNFILLGYPLYQYWPEYFVEALENKLYRTNAIRYALCYFAKDGEIESDGSNSLIGYLIRAGYIDQYEAEIDNFKLSKEEREIIRKRIKDITKDVAMDKDY